MTETPPECLKHYRKLQKSLQNIVKEVNAHFPECETWKDSPHDPLARNYYTCGEAMGVIRQLLAQMNLNIFNITSILERLKYDFLSAAGHPPQIISVLPIEPPSTTKKEPPPGTVT